MFTEILAIGVNCTEFAFKLLGTGEKFLLDDIFDVTNEVKRVKLNTFIRKVNNKSDAGRERNYTLPPHIPVLLFRVKGCHKKEQKESGGKKLRQAVNIFMND